MFLTIAVSSWVLLLCTFLLFGSLTLKLVSVLVGLVTVWQFKRPSGAPPGPRGVPFLGYVPFLGNEIHETYVKLSKKYGPVFSVYLGVNHVVVLNDFKTIKSALAEQGDVFSGRPKTIGGLVVNEEARKSLIAMEGQFWKEHRRFSLTTLRDVGMGRSVLEPAVLDEIQRFIAELEKSNGEPVDIENLLGLSICNNLCILEFGKRFDYNDPTFLWLKQNVDILSRDASFGSLPALFGSWILKVPFINRIGNDSMISDASEALLVPMRKTLAERKKAHVPGSKDDYIDAYITETEERKKSNNYPEFFDETTLLGNLSFLFVAATDTTTVTIRVALLQLIMKTDIQRKVQQEIDDVIGRERLPCMDDKTRMPYTEAVILETHRWGSVLRMNVPHSTTEDVNFAGYHIPKDTPIHSNLWAVHHDESIFPDPHSFRPERFINEKGAFVKHEAVIPFAIGKRMCLGESLARMEIFLYLTMLLQRFNIVNPDGQVLTTEGRGIIVHTPIPYLIRLVPRSE